MNKKAETRIKMEAADHAVPQSLAEVNDAVAEIGQRQRERTRIETEMNDNLALVRQQYEAAAKPHADRISDLTKGVATWCEAHRGELTKDGKTKTARLATGEVSWRMRPPSVAVRGLDAVIVCLRSLGLDRYLRTKVELDKERMLADPDDVRQIKGITISQREDFVIKPDLTQLEEIR